MRSFRIITFDKYYQHDQIKCDDNGQDVEHEEEKEDEYTKISWGKET